MNENLILMSLSRLRAMKEHYTEIGADEVNEYNKIVAQLAGIGHDLQELCFRQEDLKRPPSSSPFGIDVFAMMQPLRVPVQLFRGRIAAVLNYLEAISPASVRQRTYAMASLESVCANFGRFVHQLEQRYDAREPVQLKDEYDVQDLLHAVLRLFFDDVRKEESTPSHAGKYALMDFFIPETNAVVETKYVRDKAHGKKVSEEIIVDVARYKPRCRLMLALIYDPKKHIDNPKGVISDLGNNSSDEMEVRAFICN